MNYKVGDIVQCQCGCNNIGKVFTTYETNEVGVEWTIINDTSQDREKVGDTCVIPYTNLSLYNEPYKLPEELFTL